NLHAPHNIDLKSMIELTCQDINLMKYVPDRVIIVGDFNDGNGQLLKKSINAFGKEIRIPQGNIVPKTCCTDAGYKFVGDYILDSNQNDGSIYFGVPRDYDRNKDL